MRLKTFHFDRGHKPPLVMELQTQAIKDMAWCTELFPPFPSFSLAMCILWGHYGRPVNCFLSSPIACIFSCLFWVFRLFFLLLLKVSSYENWVLFSHHHPLLAHCGSSDYWDSLLNIVWSLPHNAKHLGLNWIKLWLTSACTVKACKGVSVAVLA